jgi:hypothetical protein
MKQWYYLQGETQKGPFDYREMIELMQKGELFDYHYIWSPGMESWSMLAEVNDFSRDRLALLIETQGKGADGFLRRDSQRLSVNISIFSHNNEGFFQGTCTNLSVNGALITLNSPFILPSQEIVIQFCACPSNPIPFKVQAVVVRKHVSKQILHIRSGLEYAVRFLKIQSVGQEIIDQLVTRQTSPEQ